MCRAAQPRLGRPCRPRLSRPRPFQPHTPRQMYHLFPPFSPIPTSPRGKCGGDENVLGHDKLPALKKPSRASLPYAARGLPQPCSFGRSDLLFKAPPNGKRRSYPGLGAQRSFTPPRCKSPVGYALAADVLCVKYFFAFTKSPLRTFDPIPPGIKWYTFRG